MIRWLLLSALVACFAPPRARAFSDPSLFAQPTSMGGGDGRFFTGAPLDSYTCKVCHSGGPEPQVSILGLPTGGYVPGQSYDIQVTWTEPQVSHSLALEFVNGLGQNAGSLLLPAEGSVGPDGRCGQTADGLVAASLQKQGSRSLINLSDCGAARLVFRFTAGADPETYLALAVVRSDSSSTPQGDGVWSTYRKMHALGLPSSAPPPRGAPDVPTNGPPLPPLGVIALVLRALAWLTVRTRALAGRRTRVGREHKHGLEQQP
jgi:hypothetical protein